MAALYISVFNRASFIPIYQQLMTIRLEVGKALTPQFAVTGKLSTQAYGTEDFAWAVELSLTFSFDR
jgi:hypothetical protein